MAMAKQTFGGVLDGLIKNKSLSLTQFVKKIGVGLNTAQELVGKPTRFSSDPGIIRKIAGCLDIGIHEPVFTARSG